MLSLLGRYGLTGCLVHRFTKRVRICASRIADEQSASARDRETNWPLIVVVVNLFRNRPVSTIVGSKHGARRVLVCDGYAHLGEDRCSEEQSGAEELHRGM